MFEHESRMAGNCSIPPPRDLAAALQRLPLHILLNRFDDPTIVIGLDGVVVYANPACERLLGYQSPGTLEGRSLATLLSGQSNALPGDWIESLCDPDAVTNWKHSDGYPVATLPSDPLTLPDDVSMLMVSLQDVSGQMWPEVDRAYRMDPQHSE